MVSGGISDPLAVGAVDVAGDRRPSLCPPVDVQLRRRRASAPLLHWISLRSRRAAFQKLTLDNAAVGGQRARSLRLVLRLGAMRGDPPRSKEEPPVSIRYPLGRSRPRRRASCWRGCSDCWASWWEQPGRGCSLCRWGSGWASGRVDGGGGARCGWGEGQARPGLRSCAPWARSG